MVVEQITKADRDACHAICGESKLRATLRRLSSAVSKKEGRGNGETPKSNR